MIAEKRMVLNGSIRERVWQMLSCGGYSRNRKVSSDGCEGHCMQKPAYRFFRRQEGFMSGAAVCFQIVK